MTALKKDPSFQLAQGLDALRAQRSQIMAMMKKDPANAAMYQGQLAQIRNGILAAKANPQNNAQGNPYQQQTNDLINQNNLGYQKTLQAGNDALTSAYQKAGAQGDFNPGSFADQQNAAYGHVMDQFNRTNQQQFDQQEKQFQQMAAERGWDPNSEVYRNTHAQMMSEQNNARLNAMDSAYGQGLAAQNQGYQQALSTYQQPYQNLQYLDPVFRYQTQYQMQGAQDAWQAQQNALDWQNKIKLQQMQDQTTLSAAKHSGGGGGGGGLSLQDQLALQNNSFYNQMALLASGYGQQPQPSAGNGFASGVGAGIGMGIGAGIGGGMR